MSMRQMCSLATTAVTENDDEENKWQMMGKATTRVEQLVRNAHGLKSTEATGSPEEVWSHPWKPAAKTFNSRNRFEELKTEDDVNDTKIILEEARAGVETMRIRWQSDVDKQKEERKARKTKRKKDNVTIAGEVNFLGEKKSNGLSNMRAAGFREVEVTVDSGACDTVIPPEEYEDIPTVESEQSKQGFEYEVANGDTIPNLGEKRCLMMTERSRIPKRIDFQVADVHKPLLAVSRAADMGYETRLGKQGGCLLDTVTGEAIPIRRKGNLYVMRVWIKAVPFSRQG